MDLIDNNTMYLIAYFVSIVFLIFIYLILFKNIMKIQNVFFDEIIEKIDFLYENSEAVIISHLKNTKNESIKIHTYQNEILKELREFSAFLLESQKQIIQLNKQLDKRYELENEIIKLKKINARLSKNKESK